MHFTLQKNFTSIILPATDTSSRKLSVSILSEHLSQFILPLPPYFDFNQLDASFDIKLATIPLAEVMDICEWNIADIEIYCPIDSVLVASENNSDIHLHHLWIVRYGFDTA